MITIPYCGYDFRNPDRDRIFRPFGTTSWLFLLVLCPMVFYFSDREEVQAEAGACILYTPGHPQHYQAAGEFLNSFVHFTCEDSLPDEYGLIKNKIFYPDCVKELNDILKIIQREYLNGLEHSGEMEDLLVRQLLLHLRRSQPLSHPRQQGRYYPELFVLREQMLEHSDRPWSLEQMCRQTNMGKSQLYHYYNLYFHASPVDELLNARLARVKYLLDNDAMTIKQVAYASGFQNLCHFNRFFKSRCGCTPTEFRRLGKAGAATSSLSR
ncbi:MAG: helix-turn-helix transcriptional regulator [Hungatella sp.]|nr:helix-turn-helix transcriptional regulator [Hungatella sp.]